MNNKKESEPEELHIPTHVQNQILYRITLKDVGIIDLVFNETTGLYTMIIREQSGAKITPSSEKIMLQRGQLIMLNNMINKLFPCHFRIKEFVELGNDKCCRYYVIRN